MPKENGMPVLVQNHQNVLRARLRSPQFQITVSEVQALRPVSRSMRPQSSAGVTPFCGSTSMKLSVRRAPRV